MDPMTIGLIGLGVFLLLLAAGVPVGFSMCIMGFAGFAILVSPGAALAKLAIQPVQNMMNFTYAVFPAFILMARIFEASGFGGDLFNVAEKWLGHRRGGLAFAAILAAAVFAAISASTVATILTIGLVAIPEMLKRGYDPDFSAASICAAGGLGPLIPPSGLLMIYGIATENSIKSLFMAGVGPGIILALLYIVVVILVCKVRPSTAPVGPKYTFRQKMKSLLSVGDVLAVIIISIGGLFAGFFTPTEAGAAGAGGAMIVAVVRRRITWKGFVRAVKDTAINTGMIGLVVLGAMVFSYFVTVSTVPQRLVEFVQSVSASPVIIMIIVTLMYLVLGCFVDSLAMILLTLPFVYPLITSIGINPITFGIYVVLVSEMAGLTPPVGINVFVAGGMHPGLSVDGIFKNTWPFVVTLLVMITALLVFPQLSLFLPRILA